jgi:hypothetical protein
VVISEAKAKAARMLSQLSTTAVLITILCGGRGEGLMSKVKLMENNNVNTTLYSHAATP